MVFAAGLGTRLYPLTADRPKALVEYQGKTLLEHVLQKIIDSGIHHIVVNIHHFPDLMIQFIENHNFDADIEISDERDLLRETGGGLKYAARFFKNSTHILLHNVDIISDLSFQNIIDNHLNDNALATLAVRQRETNRYFLFDENQQLCGWKNTKTGEEIHTRDAASVNSLAFSGVHIVKRELLDLIPNAEKQSITPIYLELSKSYAINAFIHNEGQWHDMGKIEDFKAL